MDIKEFEKKYNSLLKKLADSDDPGVLTEMSQLMDSFHADALSQYPEICRVWDVWDSYHRAIQAMQDMVQKVYCEVFGIKPEAFDPKQRFILDMQPEHNTINCIIDFGSQPVTMDHMKRIAKALGSPEFVMVPDCKSFRPRMFMKFNLLTSKVMGYFIARRFVCYEQAQLQKGTK